MYILVGSLILYSTIGLKIRTPYIANWVIHLIYLLIGPKYIILLCHWRYVVVGSMLIYNLVGLVIHILVGSLILYNTIGSICVRHILLVGSSIDIFAYRAKVYEPVGLLVLYLWGLIV